MDVRAKQLLSYQRRPLFFTLSLGFRPTSSQPLGIFPFCERLFMTKLLEEKLSPFKAKVLDAGIVFGKNTVVTELFYNLDTLVISVDPDVPGKMLRVTFDEVRGFRCLDEGDLTDFWMSGVFAENTIFEVTAGGWLDQEDKREGFLSKAIGGYREFFITGVNDCINILASEPPKFKIEEVALNPES
jgi:hypothetical protein